MRQSRRVTVGEPGRTSRGRRTAGADLEALCGTERHARDVKTGVIGFPSPSLRPDDIALGGGRKDPRVTPGEGAGPPGTDDGR